MDQQVQQKEDHLKQKLKSYQLPQCGLDELHEQLSQICIDPAQSFSSLQPGGNGVQLVPLCSGCVEDKKYIIKDTGKYNQLRQLRRLVLDLGGQALKKDQKNDSLLQRIESEVKELADKYSKIGEKCHSISLALKDCFFQLKQYNLKEFDVKNKCFQILESLLDSEGSDKLNENLKELQPLLCVKNDNIVIDNSKFEKDFQEKVFQANSKINNCQTLATSLLNTLIFDFDFDRLQNNSQPSNPQNQQQTLQPGKQTNQENNNKKPTSQEETLQRNSQDNNNQSPLQQQKQQQQQRSMLQSNDMEPFIINPNPDPNLQYFYSVQLKSKKIINNDRTFTLMNENAENNKIEINLVEPCLNFQDKQYFIFKAGQIKGTVFLGFTQCQNNNNFQIDLNNPTNSYMVDNNGLIRTSENPSNPTQSEFAFLKDELIIIMFDPKKKKLAIKIKQTPSDPKKAVNLEAKTMHSDQGGQWYLFVGFNTQGDSMFFDNSEK